MIKSILNIYFIVKTIYQIYADLKYNRYNMLSQRILVIYINIDFCKHYKMLIKKIVCKHDV